MRGSETIVDECKTPECIFWVIETQTTQGAVFLYFVIIDNRLNKKSGCRSSDSKT